MTILALDQAARTTGWAVFHEGELISNGKFTIPSSLTMGERLTRFVLELEVLLDTYDIDHIYYEGIQYQSNAETYKKLAYIQAMIMYVSENKKYKYTEMSPSHWRSILHEKYKINFGRNRKEQKNKAKEFVEQQFKIFPTEDECDAICLGLAGVLENEKNRSAF